MDLSQNRLPPSPHGARGVGERARPLSRGFSKRLEGRWSRERDGAKGGAPRYKGRTACEARAVSRWSMFSLLSFLAWFMRSWSCERPVCWKRGWKAQLCRLCGVDQRVWTRSAGESSPATREARKPGASTLAVVGAGRHDSTTTKGGAGNLHGLVGPFGQPRPTL